MQAMKIQTYIVRVYRRRNGDPHNQAVGMVEEVESGMKCAFRNVHELRKLLGDIADEEDPEKREQCIGVQHD